MTRSAGLDVHVCSSVSDALFDAVVNTMVVTAVGPFDRHRRVARAMKRNGPALWVAAARMSRLVPAGSVIVPVPSSDGTNDATMTLARLIAAFVGSTVVEAVERSRCAPSQRAQHATRSAVCVGCMFSVQHSTLAGTALPSETPSVVLVDNVTTTGATLAACAARMLEASPHVTVSAAVYADARQARR